MIDGTIQEQVTMRAFFAIELEAAIKNQIFQTILELKNTIKFAVKWVKAENLHLTVRFLGNIFPEQMDDICKSVQFHLQQQPLFDIRFQHFMVFPHHRPQVIVLGMHLSPELSSLIRAVEQGVMEAGFTPEQRPFVPHITLGRITKPHKVKLHQASIEPISQPVTHIVFYQSELTPAGSLHTPLKRLSFCSSAV